MPGIARLFAGAGWSVRDLDVVAVVLGPGSFTGIRVGLSAAKGLCEASGVRVVAMSRLGLVAGMGAAEGVPSIKTVALLDAGRGEFYCGVYTGGECLSEGLVGLDHVRELATGRALATCESRVQAALVGLDVRLVNEPGAEEMLAWARERMVAGDWTDVASVDANYLRRTDAELVFERRGKES